MRKEKTVLDVQIEAVEQRFEEMERQLEQQKNEAIAEMKRLGTLRGFDKVKADFSVNKPTDTL